MPIDNRPELRRLLDGGRIRLERHEFLDQQPPEVGGPLTDRVEGMLLGLAIGDALGRSSEGLRPQDRRARRGEVRDYLDRDRDGRPIGYPSDDTQLAFWTLERLLDDDGLDAAAVTRHLAAGDIRGIGQTVLGWLVAVKNGAPWDEAAQHSAGNGALMRIAPVLIPHLPSPSSALWADAAILARLTHDDAASTAACVAFVDLLWQLLGMRSPPAADWWVHRFCGTMEPLEGETEYRPRGAPIPYAGPVSRFTRRQVVAALREDLPVEAACERWHSGAYLLETVPSVLYILCRHGSDPEEAIIRAVNDTVDNDTIAAVVGAAVGALHGRGALPERWLEGLSGRTRSNDDGRVFELASRAADRWAR
jgi:ADP-ribosyl-[dinitrogen reductase] hydrolase